MSTLMSDSGQYTRKRGRVAAETIRDDGMRNSIGGTVTASRYDPE